MLQQGATTRVCQRNRSNRKATQMKTTAASLLFRGKTYSVNFPLRDGIDDKSYQAVFKPIMQEIMDRCLAVPTVPRGSQPNLFSAVAARWGGHKCALRFDHSTRVCPLGLAVPHIGLHTMVRSIAGTSRARSCCSAAPTRSAATGSARSTSPSRATVGPSVAAPSRTCRLYHCSTRRRRADQPTPAAARHGTHSRSRTARQ